VALVSALAGCGGTASSDSGHLTTSDAQISDFTFAIDSPVSSLDYGKDDEIQTTGMIMSLVTQPLEALSPTNTYSPVLATSVDQPNDTTLVYHLRSGVKFSNGAPLTATDVVWSIKHYASASDTSSQMPTLKSVTATGPLTVTVQLVAPDPQARPEIAMTVLVQNAAFGEAHASDLGTASAVPIGTGPYVVSSDTSSAITLTRRAHYWGTSPLVKELTFSVITDDNSRQLAIQSGSVDASPITNLKSLATWKALKGAHLDIVPTSSEDFFGFDVAQAPFNNLHVREAIAYAIQRNDLATAAFDGNVSQLTGGFVPAYELSDVAGTQSAASAYLASLPSYSYSLAQAKAQLKLSPYPHGFATTVMYIETLPWEETVVLALQQELKPLGITVTAKPVSENYWFTQFFTGKLTGLNLATFFNALDNDPAGLLTNMVGASGVHNGGTFNFSHFTSPQVEADIATVTSDASPASRWTATKGILAAIADNVAYIPLWTEPDPIVISDGYTLTSPAALSLFTFSSGQWIYAIRSAK